MAQDVELEDPIEAYGNLAAAELLGKALFWDIQVGGGNGASHACASCHYQAGADSHPERIANSILPNGIVGSRGVLFGTFEAITVTGGVCDDHDQGTTTGVFNITGRQAPPAVESRNIHNFWDGRANNVFNGMNPSGEPTAGLWTEDGEASVTIFDSSQASQAVGPPNNEVEMSYLGRTFQELGYKMMRVVPLGQQTGDIADGLHNSNYGDLIIAAFGGGPLEAFISNDPAPGVTARVNIDGAGVTDKPVTITENNFSLFFGLAIQAYEQTLVAKVPRPTRAQLKSFKRLRCARCHDRDGSSHAETGDLGRRAFAVNGVVPLAEDAGVVAANLSLGSPVPNDDNDPGVGFTKSSHLFNLALTGPYFHDGRIDSIEGVIDFYIRGGNNDLPELDSQIRPLKLRGNDRQNVIDMMNRLVDPRIAEGTGPYAHPSLPLYVDDLQPDVITLKLEASDAGNGGLSYVAVP